MADMYEISKAVVTNEMKEEVKDIMDWLREDYKRNNEKIGRMRCDFEFEEYYETKSFIDEHGRKVLTGEIDTSKPMTYECVIYIYAPFKKFGFTDRHKYRWNSKWNRFEHEETEVI